MWLATVWIGFLFIIKVALNKKKNSLLIVITYHYRREFLNRVAPHIWMFVVFRKKDTLCKPVKELFS